MANEMKRGRSQVIWRYTPGATFRYNDSGAWCTTADVTLEDPKPLDGALASAVAGLLRNWDAISPDKFPDPLRQPHRYAVGEPYQVVYTLFPLVFLCRRCGRVHFYSDLSRLAAVNDRLGCMTCKDKDLLRQVPYAYVCECGRLDSISMQKHDRTHPIELIDKGSFRESFWRCKLCGTPLNRDPREGLGYRRCDCAPKKGKRGILLEDNRVYYSHSITLVEISPVVLERWQDHPKFADLLLGACLRLGSYRESHLQDLASYRGPSTELSPELRAMVDLLVSNGIPRDQAEQMARQSSAQAGGDVWTAYERELQPLRQHLPDIDWSTHRGTIEYVFVRDEPSIGALSLSRLAKDSEEGGLAENASRLHDEEALAKSLGLIDLRIVQALPTVLAGVGYSRYSAFPREADGDDSEATAGRGADLRPYGETKGRIPLYVARNTTEALLYHLDPWRVAAFLKVNAEIDVPANVLRTEQQVRAWLMGQTRTLAESGQAHFILRRFETKAGVTVDEVSALVFGVLHTISHVLKATAHRFVGLDGDALAEYLFPAHGAGLLYASRYVAFTLGGIDAAFKSNLRQWLGSARDYAGQCSFDPVCARGGGACLACLYPKFGCNYFNRTVSRSFLFGGAVSGYPRRIEGFWSRATTDATKDLERP
jgi:hypothetical protein